MRILHIDTEKTWRGGQNQTRLLIEGSLAKGHHPYLAAPRDSALAHAMKDYIPVLEYDGWSGFNWRVGKTIGRYCATELIDIIDAQTAKAHNLALIATCYAKDTKVLVHRRVDYSPTPHPFNIYKYRTKRVAGFIAISSAIADVLRKFGVRDSKIHVVKSAASPIDFQYPDKESAKRAFAAKNSLALGKVWVGNASALSAQKDYPTLLRALARLKRENIPFLGLIAGTGKLEKELKSQAKELGLSDDDLVFLGFRNDIPDFLQALDILAVSSQDEGLGTIILDAYQAGCVVTATQVGGIPEIVEHGKNGLLSPKHDDDQFAQNLKKLIASEGIRQLYADNGKRKVETEFSAKAMIEGNLKVYAKMLEQL